LDLMTRFGIPAEAIIVDPHARHTTTNMRNAARLIYRYGIPFDKKSLVSTDRQQSEYIEGAVFEKRCLDELGYLPYRLERRTSAFDLEFVPQIESLHADPADPLDPLDRSVPFYVERVNNWRWLTWYALERINSRIFRGSGMPWSDSFGATLSVETTKT